tara:strand:- start:210 stop:1421 length:1212 start_codon:yes stop_codon:yes gene_type:complete
MANQYGAVPRPTIRIERPERPDWEGIISDFQKKFFPSEEEKQELRLREDANDRANALLQLRRNEQVQTSIQNSKDNARADRLATIKEDENTRIEDTHQEAIKDKEFKIAEEDFNIGWNDRIKDNDIGGALAWASGYTTSNPRLSKKIASLEKNLSGKNMILESNVTALEGMLPGIIDKLGGRSIVKSILFKDPTAIAKEMLISEVGKITGDNEKEFERQATLIGLKLKQTEQMIDSPEKQAIMTSITEDINKFTEKSGVNVDNLLNNVGDIGIDVEEEPEYKASGVVGFLEDLAPTLGTAEKIGAKLGFPSAKKAVDKRIYKKNIEPYLIDNDAHGLIFYSALANVYGKNKDGEIGFLNEKGARLFKNTVPEDKQEQVLSVLKSYHTNPKKWLLDYYRKNPDK